MGAQISKTDLRNEVFPIYRPLDPSKSEIRLLKLYPGRVTVPLKCLLLEASLEQPDLTYEALSYCWGDESGAESITLNCEPFSIRPNLFRALIRLRQRITKPLVLWIDFICINQDDIAEREQQVKLMGEIYSRASNCIIWLGEFYEMLIGRRDADFLKYTSEFPLAKIEDDELTVFHGDSRDQEILQAVLDFHSWAQTLADISSWQLQYWGGRIRYMHYTAAFCTLSSMAQDGQHLRDLHILTTMTESREFLKEVLEALGNILEGPWWTRIWTVQEAILPTNATVVLGSISMPLDTVLRASQNVLHHLNLCCNDWMFKLSVIQPGTGWFSSEGMINASTLSYVKNKYRKNGLRIDSSELVGSFRHRLATDPRDKVYGLLGLLMLDAENKTLLLEPDYSLPAGEIYARATMRIFNVEQSLNFLYFCDGNSLTPSDETDYHPPPEWDGDPISGWRLVRTRLKAAHIAAREASGLPTWVGPWETSLGAAISSAGRFTASNRFYEEPRLNEDDATQLCVSSRFIARIESLSEPFDEGVGRPVLAQILEMVDFENAQHNAYPIGSSSSSSSSPSSVTIGEALLRTLIGDSRSVWVTPDDRSSIEKPTQEDLDALKGALEKLVFGEPITERDSDGRVHIFQWGKEHSDHKQYQLIVFAMMEKYFFITSSGSFGLASGDPQVGDEIHILIGASVPFVLRRVFNEDGKEEGLRRYKIVGHCYVHGIMEGEAMRDYKAGEGVRLLLK